MEWVHGSVSRDTQRFHETHFRLLAGLERGLATCDVCLAVLGRGGRYPAQRSGRQCIREARDEVVGAPENRPRHHRSLLEDTVPRRSLRSHFLLPPTHAWVCPVGFVRKRRPWAMLGPPTFAGLLTPCSQAGATGAGEESLTLWPSPLPVQG